MKFKNIAFILVLSMSLIILAPPAHADWQGEMQIKMDKNPTKMAGKAYGKDGALRVDMDVEQGGKVSMISDYPHHKVYTLMHAQKMYATGDMNGMGAKMPSCSTKDIEGCLEKNGYKKTGSDSANGHPCDVYEKDDKISGVKNHQKLWRPTDLKEVPFVRTESKSASDTLSTFDILNVKIVSALSSSLFSPPADYHVLQMPKGYGSH